MRRKALVGILELLKPALADQAMVPIFLNYCFTGETVYAYNDALGIVAPFETETPFSVHGETLLGLLKNSRTEEIEFDFEDTTAVVKAGKSRMKLPFLEESEFLFNEPDEEWDVELEITNTLLEALAIVMTTTSNDNSTPALMGVNLNTGDGINLYSCDGDAVSHYLIDGANYGGEGNYMIPNEFCSSLLRICGKDKSVNGILKVSPEWALAELENGYKLYGRIIETSDELDHANVIEKELRGEDPPWIEVPKGLDHALSRARVVADPSSASTKIAIKDGRLRLSSETAIGVVKDNLPLKEDHPEVEAIVSAALMQRLIGVCTEMAVRENCTVYRKGEDLFQVASNIGER